MANERRIVELVLKATGEEELKRIARGMVDLNNHAAKTQNELEKLGGAFKTLGASAAGLWVGNQIQQGFQLLVSTVSDAITEMDELATSGEAAGSALNQAAIGGAVELSNAVEELSQQTDKLVKDFVGGLAPALTLIVKQMSGAVTGMGSMFEAGQAVGAMIADQVGQFNKAVATLGAYAEAVSFAAQTVNHAAKAWDAALAGNLALSDQWMKSAQAAARAAVVYGTSAQQLGQAAYDATISRYNTEVGAAAKGGFPGAAPGKAKGGGGASSRAPAIKEEAAANDLYADTMERVSVAVVEAANAFQKADEERKKWVEGVPIRSNDEWERQQEEQIEMLKRAQAEWGGLADAMGQATYDIISGTEKIGTAVKRMVAQMIAEFVRLQLIKLANKFISPLIGGLSFSAAGNAFGSAGIISTPTAHAIRGGGIGIAGENGPEAILPLQRNSSGQLGVASGGLNVTVNNNVPGAQVAVRETDQGLQIDLIENQLADRIRRGGTALPGALENTYRNGRFASAY